jgi:uncharacterized protein YbjT (DUF2867 family)
MAEATMRRRSGDALATGETVRAASRNPEGIRLPAEVETVALDLTEPTTFATALHGVRKVFLYANAHGAQAFAEAARASGVEHVVLLSPAIRAVTSGNGPRSTQPTSGNNRPCRTQ